MRQVVIIGGGLAGLCTAFQLATTGIPVCVFERKSYPFHRVCGEYISNEVRPFLESLDLFPHHLKPTSITRFQLSATTGQSSIVPLDMGGFGISRYAFDHFLYERARAAGVRFELNTEVTDVHFDGKHFLVKTDRDAVSADVVIGSFGKRSRLDVVLQRRFVRTRSPYVGVKYHARVAFPSDLIALHNFEGGYCGVSAVEGGAVNICYLAHRSALREHKSIPEMEKAVLYKNPQLNTLFESAHFLTEKPETINEISFETKEPVWKHMLLIGDAAGMITPLCGNGMAMAIHASKLASTAVIRFMTNQCTRSAMELEFSRSWRSEFWWRLWYGRQVQKLFGTPWTSRLAVGLVVSSTSLARQLIKRTHGDFV